MSKRIARLMVLLVLVSILVLSGCTQPAQPNTTPTSSAATTSAKPSTTSTSTSTWIPFDKQELPKFMVAYSQPGGQGERQTTAISAIISKYSPIKASVTLVSGGLGNAADSIRKGEIDWFPTSPPTPWAAYTGTSMQPPLRLRQLFSRDAAVEGNNIGLWVLPKSGIKSGKDLIGKKIIVDPGQVWSRALVVGVLQANGATDKNFTEVQNANYTTAFEMLVDGRVDAVPSITGSTTQQFSKTDGVFMLPLTKTETAAVVKLEPSLNEGMTSANYLGLGASQWGIVVPDCFWCRPGLSEKAVYTFDDTLFNHLDEWYNADPRNVMLKLKTAADDMGWKVPFHPGSIRWFKDKGLWTPAHDAKQKLLIEQEKKIYGDVPDEEAFRILKIIP